MNFSLLIGCPPVAWKRAIITFVPKVAQPKESSDFRPISVTSILSSLVEKIIVRKYLLYALPQTDQFAYKPTGSTTAALIAVTHHVRYR